MFRKIYFVLLSMALLVVGCMANYTNIADTSVKNNTEKSYCNGTLSVIEQAIGQPRGLISTSRDAYIVLPPEGCDIPALICIYQSDIYAAGLSCNVFEP